MIKKKITHLPGNKIAIDVSCSKCGKPITEANKYGMYCEDFCGLNEDKEAAKCLRKMFGGFEKLAKGFFDGVAPTGEDND